MNLRTEMKTRNISKHNTAFLGGAGLVLPFVMSYGINSGTGSLFDLNLKLNNFLPKAMYMQ